MSKEKLFQVGVKALIENQNRILLVHDIRSTHREAHWDIPGGRIQEGQTIMEALARELQEEIGVSSTIHQEFFTAIISNFEILFEGKKLGLLLLVYKVQIPANTTIMLSQEHDKYEWVDKKEASKRLAYKYPSGFTNLLTE